MRSSTAGELAIGPSTCSAAAGPVGGGSAGGGVGRWEPSVGNGACGGAGGWPYEAGTGPSNMVGGCWYCCCGGTELGGTDTRGLVEVMWSLAVALANSVFFTTNGMRMRR